MHSAATLEFAESAGLACAGHTLHVNKQHISQIQLRLAQWVFALYDTVDNLSLCLLQSRHPLMPKLLMEDLLERCLTFGAPEDIWKVAVQGLCKPEVWLTLAQ